MTLRPVEISLSQLYRGVASRGGASTETIDTEEERTNLPQEMDSSADSPGTITEAEFTGYFVAGAPPVTVQTQDGKTYQISVNSDGTLVQEVVQEENPTAPAEEGTQGEQPVGDGRDLAPAQLEATDTATREALELYLRTIRAIRENVKARIAEADQRLEETERQAEKRRLAKIQERTDAAIARLEARLLHTANLSDADRAAIEAQIQDLQALQASVDALSSGLADGTVTQDEVAAKLGEIEVQLTGLENKLQDEETQLLTAAYGEHYDEYVRDPATALDDGVITKDELTETGQRVTLTYMGDLDEGGISFGELQILRDGGNSFAVRQARQQFAEQLGLQAPTDESNKAFDELLVAAREGTLDADKQNEILDENGFPAEDSDDTYHITDDAFEASFFAERGGDEVSGAVDFYRGINRTYQNLLIRGGTGNIAEAYKIYIKEEDFYFVDFERQGQVLYAVFAEAYSEAHDGAIPTTQELVKWLLDPATVLSDGLREVLNELYGRRSFAGANYDTPESELTEEQKRFRALIDEESPDYNPQLAWAMIVPLAINQVFNGIQATGDTEQEIYSEKMRIFEDVMTAVQEIPQGDVEAAMSGTFPGGESIFTAYAHEVRIVLIDGGRENIDHQAVLDGTPHPLPDGDVITREEVSTVADATGEAEESEEAEEPAAPAEDQPTDEETPPAAPPAAVADVAPATIPGQTVSVEVS